MYKANLKSIKSYEQLADHKKLLPRKSKLSSRCLDKMEQRTSIHSAIQYQVDHGKICVRLNMT